MATPRVKPEDRKKLGRPTDYKPEYAKQVYKYALLGCDDAEIAHLFDVREQTINNWKHKHPDFLESLKDGKGRADAEVAHSLRERATGYEWDEKQAIKVKRVLYKDGRRVSEIEEVVLVDVHRVVPPDTTSAIFWLKNRHKLKWRDNHDITSDGEKVQIAPMYGGVSTDEQPTVAPAD